VDSMTINQILYAYNGYFERESERAKAVMIVGWETTRWNTFIMWNLHVMKKDRLRDPKQLIKFDWDKEIERPTEEQWKAINDKFPDKDANS
jgi:hypothetical protein